MASKPLVNPQPEVQLDVAEGGIDKPQLESTDPESEGEEIEAAEAADDLADDDPEVEVSTEEDSEDEPEGMTLTIPTRAMSKIKKAEREKGRREAEAEFAEQLSAIRSESEQKLQSVARMFGFSNLDEMESADPEQFWAAKQEQSRPISSPQPEIEQIESEAKENTVSEQNEIDDRAEHPRYTKRLERENQRLLEEKKRLNRARAHEERRRRVIEAEKERLQAETDLRIAATRAGIQDVEYAMHLLKKDIASKSVEELADFDEAKFFGEHLREKAPYIYKTETQLASTSPGPGQQSKSDGGAPLPGRSAAPSNGSSNEVDANKMSREDYHQLLRKRGLTDPSVGMPS